MIVGTVGHIDHGKTTLVRALTGIDTDRLKEEKARGISIELGYAYVPLGDQSEILGFVDMPGHERLIHTMVAGASGIDFALLVIAADDGIMPQTREHLAIIELLGIARGAVALTKSDRVDRERVAQVRAEVQVLLAPTLLRGSPIFPLDATAADDTGTLELREHLHAMAAGLTLRRDDGLFRLAVDRVFTLSGHGTIAAGTVMAGRVCAGDTVAIMPNATPVRVRSIHAQNRAAQIGRAGQRCALNLAGVDKNQIARGDWLSDPRALAVTSRIDARLTLLAGAASRLSQWSVVHLHFATTHRIARVVLLDADSLAPRESGRVQFVFEAPVCAAPGVRFVARDAQAAHTIGGGLLLDPFAPARKRRSAERLHYLDALDQMVAGAGLAALLQCALHGIRGDDLVRLAGLPFEHLPLPSSARVVDAAGERFVILDARWRDLREHTLSALRDFHAQNPDEAGPDVGRLRRMAAPTLLQSVWLALIDELAHEQLLVRAGVWLRLPEHVVTLSREEDALGARLLPVVAAGRFDPPWVRDLAAQMREPEESVRRVLRKLLARGSVQQIVHDLFYHLDRIVELAAVASALAREQGRIDVGAFRDRIGLGRKRAIQILEFFDRVGYTRRVHEWRVLRGDNGGWNTVSAHTPCALPQAGDGR